MQTAAKVRKLIRWLCCLKYCLQKLIFVIQGFIHMTYAVIHWIGSFVHNNVHLCSRLQATTKPKSQTVGF